MVLEILYYFLVYSRIINVDGNIIIWMIRGCKDVDESFCKEFCLKKFNY